MADVNLISNSDPIAPILCPLPTSNRSIDKRRGGGVDRRTEPVVAADDGSV